MNELYQDDTMTEADKPVFVTVIVSYKDGQRCICRFPNGVQYSQRHLSSWTKSKVIKSNIFSQKVPWFCLFRFWRFTNNLLTYLHGITFTHPANIIDLPIHCFWTSLGGGVSHFFQGFNPVAYLEIWEGGTRGKFQVYIFKSVQILAYIFYIKH